MGRLKGSRNKSNTIRPQTSALSTEDRLRIFANLVIDKIIEDQNSGKMLFRRISNGKPQ